MIFRFFTMFHPFRRKLKEKRYWDLKELNRKEEINPNNENSDETSDDNDDKSSDDTDTEN
ncbi:hypothetical protein J7L68_01040 [bacterium]|nr:hypothetical protein [bacterium]